MSEEKTILCLPELGEGIEKATVVTWLVKEGDSVKRDDDLVELVTDKATFTVPSEVEGIVVKIYSQEDQDVKIGEALAEIKPL